MSTLNITEYAGVAPQAGAVAPVPQEPALAVQSLTYAAAVSCTFPFTPNTTLIRIISVSAFYYRVAEPDKGTASVAAGTRLPGETVEYIGVRPGQKIFVYDGVT